MLTEIEQMAAIQRVLDGDIEGFAALVTTFQEGVMRMAFAITGDRAAAEDVAQESFVSAFRNLHTYDSSRATFPAWLHGIVRNAARNFLRRKGGNRLVAERKQAQRLRVWKGREKSAAHILRWWRQSPYCEA